MMQSYEILSAMNWNDYYKNKSDRYPGLDIESRLKAVGKTEFGTPITQTSLSILKQNILNLLGKCSNFSRFIDLGCGTGIITENVLTYLSGKETYLFDPSVDNITKCEILFAKEQNVYCKVGDHTQALQYINANTVLLAYEVVQHISHENLEIFIKKLFEFNVKKIIFGGVPDIERRELFFTGRDYKPDLVNQSDEIIGYWYKPVFFFNVLKHGYNTYIFEQGELYTSKYRFDVVIERE